MSFASTTTRKCRYIPILLPCQTWSENSLSYEQPDEGRDEPSAKIVPTGGRRVTVVGEVECAQVVLRDFVSGGQGVRLRETCRFGQQFSERPKRWDIGTQDWTAFLSFHFVEKNGGRQPIETVKNSPNRWPIPRLAEGVGFEPTLGLLLSLISSQVPSTTQPPFPPGPR